MLAHLGRTAHRAGAGEIRDMPLIPRFVKSVANRGRVFAMRSRGAATRALMPGVLTGGKALHVGRNVALVVYGELIVGERVTLSDGCALEVGPWGHLILGDDVFIGRNSVVVAQQMVNIGAGTLIAEHCSVRDQDHHLDPEERAREVAARTSPVLIESRVWVGAGVRILKGSQVGTGSVVAANAVVRGQVPPGVVVGGIPARVLRSTIS
jgi:acetyltransferase-like isoleucine patch superfamily enzyme